jgi:hypothetical protein
LAFNAVTSAKVGVGANFTMYQNVDGSLTKVPTPQPTNFPRPDGKWVPVSTAIVSDAATGGFQVADNPLSPVFPKSLGDGSGYSVSAGADALTITPVAASSATATRPASALDGGTGSNAISYANVWPGEDVQYQVSSGEVKESVVLDQVPPAVQTSWSWLVHAPGLKLVTQASGAIYAEEPDGSAQIAIPTPVVTDSSGVAGQAVRVGNCGRLNDGRPAALG